MAVKRRKIKDKDGNVIAVSWSYDFYDIFKKRHQKSGFRTKPEAERAEAKARNCKSQIISYMIFKISS
ncbi:MAG: hypothetical protein PHY44_08785 [Lachnospiraceae bacterium]|nr:hypothetical protein [Lachnospiraceae bacterium]